MFNRHSCLKQTQRLLILLLFLTGAGVACGNTAPAASSLQLEPPRIGGSSYGREGITPYLLLDLANPASGQRTTLQLDLEIDGEVIYRSLPLPALQPFQQRRLYLPWTPPVGSHTFAVVVRIRDTSRQGDDLSALIAVSLTTEIRFDDVYTHPWLTRRANEFLQAKYPGGEYAELAAYVDAMAEGATHEDALDADNDGDGATQRFNRHFYRPTDGAGLQQSPGYPPHITECIESFCNSLTWGDGSDPLNDYDWLDAVGHYAAAQTWDAYFALGHVLHLVQDLAVPAHTHLDIHALSITDPPGDNLENYCEAVLSGGGSLPEPDPAASLIQLTDLSTFWSNPGVPFPDCGMGRLSYYRNRYYCDLSNHDNASGIFKEMYPDLDWIYDFWAFEYQWDIDSPDLGNWDESFGDSCPLSYAGSLGDDEFWSCGASYGNPDNYDYVYVEWTDEVPLYEKSSWNPDDPAADQYAPNSGGLSQTELLAQDLIPLAIRYSAGLMKFFFDTVNPPPPNPPVVAISWGEGSVTLTWEAVPGATGYHVYSSPVIEGPFTEDLSGTYDGPTWTAPATGTRFYRVTAVN